MEDQTRELLESLPEVGRALRAPHGVRGAALPWGQARLLMLLSHRTEMTMGELASSLDVSMPAATEMVDRLVEKGYVERAADPADRRVVRVRLAPDMEEFARQTIESYAARIRPVLEALSPAERRGLLKGLRLLGRALGPEATEKDER